MPHSFFHVPTGVFRPERNAAKIRILNASQGAPEFDVVIDKRTTEKNLFYGEHSKYYDVRHGKNVIQIFKSGRYEKPLLEDVIRTSPGQYYTLAVEGKSAGLNIIKLEDSSERSVYETKIRFVHLLPNAGPVDVISRPGGSLFTNVRYKNHTGYIRISPSSLNILAEKSSSREIIAGLTRYPFLPRSAYTLFLTGKNKHTDDGAILPLTDARNSLPFF